MIEKKSARAAIESLSDAVAAILEESHGAAVASIAPNFSQMKAQARSLRQAGEDVAVLGAAIEVFARRSK